MSPTLLYGQGPGRKLFYPSKIEQKVSGLDGPLFRLNDSFGVPHQDYGVPLLLLLFGSTPVIRLTKVVSRSVNSNPRLNLHLEDR